jgi:hypothetical protein
MLNINPAQAFVVQIVEPGSKDDTFEVRRSNEIIMYTCSEYIVFDMRRPSERVRVPAQRVAEDMYNKAMERFGARVTELMKNGDVRALKAIIANTAPNAHTARVQAYLASKGGESAGHKKIEI